MQKLNKPFSSEATAGTYLGIAGVVLSLIGVLLSIYALSSGEKSIWLGISGWLAALLVGVFLSIPLFKLINKLTEAHTTNAELLLKVNELELANSRIIEIDAFILSKSVKRQATRRERKPSEQQVENTSSEAIDQTSAEEA
ncbi:hypothetical protein [Pseudomonas chlororaphis]|uniref:hypothetical protein n=1 Tax=Pseudomonas chlororaphis TaxID=587753 RepID=UPI003C26EC03